MNPQRYSWLLISSFLGLLVLVMIVFQYFFFVPKIMMIIFVLFIVSLLGKVKIFLEDWLFFIGFIYLFDSLRGSIYIAICRFNFPVYATYVVKLEKLLFGGIPPLELQKWLLFPHPPGNFSWFEKLITAAHGSHFVAFLLVGFIIWLYKSEHFRFFKISFYLCIFLGLLGYFAIPTVPPWMAANVFGLFPRISRFVSIVYNLIIPDISAGFDTNPVAAMPSLHGAFPVLCCLILWRIYRWKAWAFYGYGFFMLFVIVYTGEHYVVDVLAGGILAMICYFAARRVTSMELRTRKKFSFYDRRRRSQMGRRYMVMIGGIVILLLGIAVGLYNRNQFTKNAQAYEVSAPKYIDFFKKGEEFRDNYQVQMYLGRYYLLKRELERALTHFERCLSLGQTNEDKARAQAGLAKCKELTGERE